MPCVSALVSQGDRVESAPRLGLLDSGRCGSESQEIGVRGGFGVISEVLGAICVLRPVER